MTENKTENVITPDLVAEYTRFLEEACRLTPEQEAEEKRKTAERTKDYHPAQLDGLLYIEIYDTQNELIGGYCSNIKPEYVDRAMIILKNELEGIYGEPYSYKVNLSGYSDSYIEIFNGKLVIRSDEYEDENADNSPNHLCEYPADDLLTVPVSR